MAIRNEKRMTWIQEQISLEMFVGMVECEQWRAVGLGSWLMHGFGKAEELSLHNF